MNLFVTGGSGFLGKRLIKRLISDNNHVTALARSDSSGRTIEQLGAKTIKGNLENISDWEAYLAGQEIVIHCAAPVEFWGSWEKFYQEITLATKNLLISASKMNVKKFIYISSESVLQDELPLIDIDETYPYPAEPNSYYGKAKKLAEEEILNFPTEMKCIILRPTYVWGKGDKTPQTLETKVKSGQFLWIDSGECVIETVHVDNLVEAISLACVKGENKEIYIVTDDDPITVRDYFTQLFKIRRINPPNTNLPSLIVNPLASIVESIWKLLNIKSTPPLSKFEISFVAMPRKYNISKIKQELDYKPIMTREMGLKEMMNS
ncbi:NAD-dependent epimerase/dehydratase family protein [Fischerella sp. PCC 9605]|uniref:NAD-dependent epimerase/dehydratase family protein n=1 Tax=Fischerella sp. PCC 9605 TaxID=1173024 RepID=UPI00047E87E6|nr:NAD(P)-dependent oxidoreductase [Fischerella sp. PCC 9605]